MNQYDLRVAKGAALLDEENPGWITGINWTTFSIRSTVECVLGQLYDEWGFGSGYSRGAQALGLSFTCGCDECELELEPGPNGYAFEYGFTVEVCRNEESDAWDEVEAAWLRYAADRKALVSQ